MDASEEELYDRAVSMPLEFKVRRAVKLLQAWAPAALRMHEEGYWLSFSGGKDSCVIKELAKMADVPFKAVYNQTTIDPPELCAFIRKHHPDVEWSLAKKVGFFGRCVIQGLPTPRARWCCRKFNELEELPAELFELDILDGSPPCSTFSTAGKREKGWGVEKVFREGQAKQRLDDLFFVYLDTVRKLKPKVCVAENVTGLIKGNAKGYVNEIVKQFREIGYEVQLFLLNGAYMEVPQKRERVFFVANRMGYPKLKLDFKFRPVPFGEVKSGKGIEIKGSVGEVASLKRLIAKARPTDPKLSYVASRERGKPIGFTTTFEWPDRVAHTVTAGGVGPIRMPEGEFCSKEDYVAMGTFAQDYWFGDDPKKAREMAHYMVGMSVPPSMTAHIADEIWEQWLSKEENR